MKIFFCGSGEFAADCLRRISSGIEIDLVVTNEPKTAGRGLKLTPTPVAEAAEELALRCKTTKRLSADGELLTYMTAAAPDIILVIDFGQMIKEPVLSLPKYGCINIHPSLLPAYRGSAPLQRAIMDGLESTAITIFKLDSGMDSGPMLAQVKVEISPEDDYMSLLAKSAKIGSDSLIRHICEVGPKNWRLVPQNGDGLSLAPKIDKSEGKIDWNRSSVELVNLIRALKYSPGTFSFFGGKRLRIYEAATIDKHGSASEILAIEDGYPIIGCGSGAIKLLSVQAEGKKIQNANEWLRGSRAEIGDSFD